MKQTIKLLLLLSLFIFTVKGNQENKSTSVRFDKNITTLKQQDGKIVPPEVLYLAVEEKYVQMILSEGLNTLDNERIILYKNKDTAFAARKSQKTLKYLEINAQEMAEDGYAFIEDKEGLWYVKELPKKYLSFDKTS